VTCIAFTENGDVLSGDSNGNLLVWPKGLITTTARLLASRNLLSIVVPFLCIFLDFKAIKRVTFVCLFVVLFGGTAEVAAAITRLPDKSSTADPIPVWVLKNVADLLTPFLTYLFNSSLATGCFLTCFKDSFVTPALKKPGLDETSPSSYGPISNLTVISKLLERVVARQLVAYLDNRHLLPTTQSGFRRGYSTETVTIRVLSDLLNAVDGGDTAALVLLNLSAAFNTVDHEILVEWLRITFGVTNSALSWFRSYLAVAHSMSGAAANVPHPLTSAVVCHKGPFFDRYSSSSTPLVWRRLSRNMVFCYTSMLTIAKYMVAVVLLLLLPCRMTSVTECVNHVSGWMSSNRLQLNADKTVLMWCTSTRRLSQLPSHPLSVAGANVYPVSVIHDVGAFTDSE